MKSLLITVMTVVSLILMSGSAYPADYDKGLEAAQNGVFFFALAEWRPLAEQGLADAQYGLGVMYRNGYGVLQDYKEAVKWYRLAAEQGHTEAQVNLGNMYFNGDGVLQDHKETVKWFRLAAEQGNAEAQFNLGVMYHKDGVLQDHKEAVKWFRLAAEQGFADAQVNLGVKYDNGEGVLQDSVYAHIWYNIASANGDKLGAEYRDLIAKNMTPSQIEKAQELARQCMKKEYKDC